MGIRTDLACEARELDPGLPGVTETHGTEGEIGLTRIAVSNADSARRIGKRMGNYVTLDAPRLAERPLELFAATSRCLARELGAFLRGLPQDAEVLVIGLGNRRVTPDSLGPRVAERVFVTRHVRQYMPEALPFPVRSVAAIAPGVLGATGVETLEAVRGVAQRIAPAVVIAVDSLAARRAERIGATVQLSDAGIDPGSGVGNLRAGLNRDTLGVPVIAVGAPLVVHAATITADTVSMMAREKGSGPDENRLAALAERLANGRLEGMIVTPKDIDSIVRDMSGIVADGINMALFGERYEEVRALIA